MATDVGDGYEVKFTETKRVYYVEKLGKVEALGTIEQDVNPGDITKNQNNQDLTGDSPETAYEVYSIEDLIQLSKMSNEGNAFENKYIKIGRDLNFKSDYSYGDKDNKEMFQDYNGDGVVEGIKEEITKDGSKGFTPLNKFSGSLLGENKSIKNISLKSGLSAEERRIGLIRYNTGTIQDLNLTGKMDISVGEEKQIMFRIGGICGDSEGKLSNIKNSTKISVNCETSGSCVYLGGIAGYSGSPEEGVKTAIVEKCTNDADISAKGAADFRMSGILGRMDDSTANNCKNSGYIRAESADYACVGGIIGDAYNADVNYSCNTGKLESIGKSRVYTGGICSMDTKLIVKNSYNTGEIIINGYAARSGGLTGSSENGTILENCYNTGKITATSNSTVIRVGGLVGCVFDRNNQPLVTIKNCYNAGIMDIQGQASQKGSIFGIYFGTVENSYAIPQTNMGIGGMTNAKITIKNSETKSVEDMKKQEFVDLLNNGGNAFKLDSGNKNNGFPVLD